MKRQFDIVTPIVGIAFGVLACVLIGISAAIREKNEMLGILFITLVAVVVIVGPIIVYFVYKSRKEKEEEVAILEIKNKKAERSYEKNSLTIKEFMEELSDSKSKYATLSTTDGNSLSRSPDIRKVSSRFLQLKSEFCITVWFQDGSSGDVYRTAQSDAVDYKRTVYSLSESQKKSAIAAVMLKHNAVYLKAHPDDVMDDENALLIDQLGDYAYCKVHICGICGKRYVKKTALASCPYCGK